RRAQAKTALPFYLEKGWRGGMRADCSRNCVFEQWKKHIEQFNQLNLEIAEAIMSAYPAPQLLIQAYNKCSSEQERETMLANIPVQRGDSVTATSQCLGQELSRLIYLEMTHLNPDYLNCTG
ncbi:EME1 endonuclease, partial [Baryphthengus martii]|nr:EME1 endonuclease [Baryphthengus martii]